MHERTNIRLSAAARKELQAVGNYKLFREPNYSEALKWCRRSAERGDIDSIQELGRMYRFGNGVPRDYVQAYMWFDIIALNLSAPEPRSINRILLEQATKERDALTAEMKPGEIAQAKKLAQEWKVRGN